MPSPNGRRRSGLANATLQQRLSAVRLFYDYLLEEGIRPDNPVGRGRYTPGKGFGGQRARGLLPRYRKLPWIPNEEQWQAVLAAARVEPLRNRVMLAMAYDAALRREELCGLATADVDPSARLLHIRAEVTKSRRARVVPYSAATDALFALYLDHRCSLNRARGPLFLSESPRNRGQPVSVWTWSKVVARIAGAAGVPSFTSHTLRHLRLTDLARTGWDLHEIAQFGGHRSTQTTLLYIHLSGRDLAAKLEQGMAGIHAWRWPLDLTAYDRTPRLRREEMAALGEAERRRKRGTRRGAWPAWIRRRLERLRRPVEDVLVFADTSAECRREVHYQFQRGMHRYQLSFWAWTREQWLHVLRLDRRQHSHAVLTVAYLLCGFRDLHLSLRHLKRRDLAVMVFGPHRWRPPLPEFRRSYATGATMTG